MRKLPMRFTSGCSAELRQPLMIRMARYRHRVFVERLGWKLHCRDALELDQFDRDDTIYVIAQNEDGEVIGTARLLPTTRPYLLAEVFPHLLNGAPAPDAPDVWELSRFASMDLSGGCGWRVDPLNRCKAGQSTIDRQSRVEAQWWSRALSRHTGRQRHMESSPSAKDLQAQGESRAGPNRRG